MRSFQILWLKFCCFLTGYNFYILVNCSEVASRKTKKYTAALLIVAVVWAFVGYCFCNRYIKLEAIGSALGAMISIFLIVQIERQILLAEKTNRWLKITRIGLALLMAIIGSLIVDQIIFKDDIDKAKMNANQQMVSSLMPEKTKEITNQIATVSNALEKKENERIALVNDINKNPNLVIEELTTSKIPIINKTIDSNKISTERTVLRTSTSKTIKSIPNPKKEQLPLIDKQIAYINNQKIIKENMLLTVKADLEKDINSKIGFIDELTIMFSILKKSSIAAVVYFIWFLFLLLLELLILIGKSNDSESDYDRTIQKQMNIHLKKIELL